MDDKYTLFIWGIAIGYSVRHFFPPREFPGWLNTILWIIVVVLGLLVLCVRTNDLKKKKKK